MSNFGQKLSVLLATFLMIALVTTFVLPGRPTPEVINSFFQGLTGAIKATLGVAGTPTATPTTDKPVNNTPPTSRVILS